MISKKKKKKKSKKKNIERKRWQKSDPEKRREGKQGQ